MKSITWLTTSWLTTSVVTGLATAALAIGSALPAGARPAAVVGQELGSMVNVRSQPDPVARVKTTVLVGDQLEVLDAERGSDGYIWYQVTLPEINSGWMREDYLQLFGTGEGGLTPGQEFSSQIGIIDSGDRGGVVQVRSGPSVWYNTRFMGNHGDKVRVTRYAVDEQRGSWYYVQYGSVNPGATDGGWVSADLVQLLD